MSNTGPMTEAARKTVVTRCVVMGLALALVALALACGLYLYYSPGRGSPPVDKSTQTLLIVSSSFFAA